MQAITRRAGVNAIDARICAEEESGNGTIPGDPPRSQQCFALVRVVLADFSEVDMGSNAGEISTEPRDIVQDVRRQQNVTSGTHSGISQIPDYRRVVSSHDIAHAKHQDIKAYLEKSSERNSTPALALNDLIKHARGAIETRLASNEAYGGFLKDFSLLKSAVVKENRQSFSTNAKYKAQKEITRAVWRNMPVKRTGFNGLLQSARTLAGKEPQQQTFPPSVLRDTAILELDSLAKWVVPIGFEGTPGPGHTKVRREKIVRRVTEILPRLNAQQQAEVISAMVAASPAEPGALKAAEKWVRANLLNEQLNIVFTEVALLCTDEKMDDEATAFLERSKAVIPLLDEAGKTELRQILTDDVMPVLKEKGWDKEGNALRVQQIIDRIG